MTGLAVLSMCISLIQEAISKNTARVMNGEEEEVAMDKIIIVPRY